MIHTCSDAMRAILKEYIRANFDWFGGSYPKDAAESAVKPILEKELKAALDEVAKEHNDSLE